MATDPEGAGLEGAGLEGATGSSLDRRTCPVCGVAYRDRSAMRRHLRRKHGSHIEGESPDSPGREDGGPWGDEISGMLPELPPLAPPPPPPPPPPAPRSRSELVAQLTEDLQGAGGLVYLVAPLTGIGIVRRAPLLAVELVTLSGRYKAVLRAIELLHSVFAVTELTRAVGELTICALADLRVVAPGRTIRLGRLELPTEALLASIKDDLLELASQRELTEAYAAAVNRATA